MASLSGNKIKDTYQSLIKLTDNGNLTTGAKQLTDGFGNNSPLYISTTQIGIGVTPEATYDLHVYQNAKVGGNLTITGDLTVNGTTTTVDTDTLRVEDPLIEVARNNTSSDAVDIGIYGKYAPSGTTLYAGLFRDTGDDKFKLFKSLEEQPTTTVNTSGTGYTVATLVANFEGTLTGTIASSTVATTQSAGDNSTKVATTAYVDSEAGNYLPLAGGTMSGNIAMGGNNISGGGTATFSSFVGDLTGNADTATALETARTIQVSGDVAGSASFDGTADINISTTIQANSVALGTDTTGNYVATISGTTNEIEVSGSGSETAAVTIGLPDDVTVTGELTVSGTGQSSFAGQVTVPATPSASTDAASKGYVDSQVGANNELSEVLANGNTTGGTDIAVSAGDKITNFTSTGIDDNATSTALTIDSSENATYTGDVFIQNTKKLNFGDDSTTSVFEIGHDGSNTILKNKFSGGHIYFINDENYGDFLFQGEDGSGGTGTWMLFDGLTQEVSLSKSATVKLTTKSTGVYVYNDVRAVTGKLISTSTSTDFNYVRLYAGSTTAQWDIYGDGENIRFTENSGGGGQVVIDSDLTVSGGDIVLGGTGRIQGIDTVSAGTDAVNKDYVDNNTVDGSGTANDVVMWSDSDTLTDAPIAISGNDSTFAGNIITETTSGNKGIKVITANDAEGFLIFGDAQDNSMGGMAYNNATNSLDIDCNNAVALSFDSSQNATFAGSVDVNGSEITVGTNNSRFAENNLRFLSSGAAYIDHNTVGQSFIFRTSASSSLDTTALTIASSGNVGIGTTSPAQPLSVHGNFLVRTTNADGNKNRMQCIVGGSSDAANLYLYYGNSGDGTVSVRLNAQGDSYLNGGNVGIGETSPQNPLHLYKNASQGNPSSHTPANATLRISDSSNTMYLDGNSIIGTGSNAFTMGNTNAADFILYTNATERMRIDSSGNVNIGTASATSSSKVTIQAQGANGSDETALVLRNYSSTPYTGYVTTEYEVGTTLMAEISAYRLNSTSGELIFRTKQSGTITDAMRITSDGHTKIADEKVLGLRTSSSDYAIQYRDLDFRFIGSADGTTQRKFSFGYYTSDNPAGTWNGQVYINSYTGSVGIGTDSPFNTLDVRHGTNNRAVFSDSSSYGDNVLIGLNDAGGEIGFGIAGSTLSFYTNVSERMRIDSSGAVGIGVSPESNRFSSHDVLQVGARATLLANDTISLTGQTALLDNLYYDSSGNFQHRGNAAGAMLQMFEGNIIFQNSNQTSGTPTVTEKMRINNANNTNVSIKAVSGTAGNEASLSLWGTNTSGFGGSLIAQSRIDSLTDGTAYGSIMRFYTNNTSNTLTERMRIDSSGKVSVGAPVVGQLGVRGTTNDSTAYSFEAANSSGNTLFAVRNDGLSFFSSGNVGIGTTSPAYKLSVEGSVNDNWISRIYNTNTNGAGLLVRTDATSANDKIALAVYADGGYKMVVRSTGNAGIGTTSPEKRLHIFDSTQTNQSIRLGNPSATPYGEINYNSTGFEHLYITAKGTTTGYGNIVFQTGGTPDERMRITAAGSVGIGTTSPRNDSGFVTLQVGSTATAASQIVLDDNDSNGPWRIISNQSLIINDDATERMRINSLGRVDIGTRSYVGSATSTTRLYLEGNSPGHNLAQLQMADYSAGFMFYLASSSPASRQACQFYNNRIDSSPTFVGSIQINSSSTAFNTSSDYRLKENVVEMTGALDRVGQLKPSRFNFIGYEEIVDGFLAHEVSDIVPEAISGTKDEVDDKGNPVYQGIDQSKLVPLLVGAIQELKAEIETLKSQINN